ncbi:hypothetical protein [Neolewinella litorea]|uniref:Lipoprotein n=1 Tax=Neolewinella litorea TaxID=2562452 RepID=A0A4S4NWR6_9BACT|nr:hypothetical protein [Neolewinella litorea]THH40720.1 hypothetical protein E4021_08305 [Neolewinella litorea]
MRYLIITLLPLFLLACTKEEVQPECPTGIGVGDLLTLPDDSALTLVRINDNRCPCDVQCFWAGYLQAVLTDGDTTLTVSDVHVADSLGIVDVVYYRGFPIAIDSVVLLTDECRHPYRQDEYCVTFTFEDRE